MTLWRFFMWGGVTVLFVGFVLAARSGSRLQDLLMVLFVFLTVTGVFIERLDAAEQERRG